MKKVFLFGKPGCARCESTKRKLTHLLDKWGMAREVEMSFVDMGTVEGLAEGAFYDVNEVPVTIVRRGADEVARWDGVVPGSDELRTSLEIRADGAGGQGLA